MTIAVAGDAVRSCRTVSPLPATCSHANERLGHSPAGGLFSVALSLGSPPPAINRYRLPMEPGLSSLYAILIAYTAIVQPSGGADTAPGCLRGQGQTFGYDPGIMVKCAQP